MDDGWNEGGINLTVQVAEKVGLAAQQWPAPASRTVVLNSRATQAFMAIAIPSGRARFGVFEVDLRSGELHKHGIKIKLHDQPFQVLAMLLEHPGELVTREQLHQKLWPADTFVDFDVGLNSAIKRLRDALGDSAEDPRFVETLPRRGYRLIAPVEEVLTGIGGAQQSPAPGSVTPEGASVSTEPRAAAPSSRPPELERNRTKTTRVRYLLLFGGVAAAILLALLFGANVGELRERLLGMHFARGAAAGRIRSLAVLPLENLSGDSAQEYFVDGMTEELITDLGKIAGLRVISRTSSMHYKGTRKTLPEIARELNVDAVIEGAVLRSGDHVRITTQLVEAASDRHLWAESYERELRNMLTLQAEVARDVAKQVNIKLSREEQTRFVSAHPVDPEALEAYLKGRYELYKMTLEGAKKSIDYFSQALDKDPTYARAWAGLSEALSFPFFPQGPRGSRPQEALAKAKAAALKALELDGALSEGHLSLGLVLERDWLWSDAEKEYQRAIALDPNNARAHAVYGRHQMAQGRLEEGIAETRRAKELDPLSPLMHRYLAVALSAAGRYDEALAQYHEVAALGGAMSYPTHRRMALAYEGKGMEREALAELLAALRSPKNWLETTPSLPGKVEDRASKQLAARVERKYASSGYREAKRVFLHGDVLHVAPSAGPIWTAADYAELGLKDRAFEWLDKAIELRNVNMEFIKVDERFAPLRSDPRFGDLLQRIGLPK
jgi:TolB-like protein/DNA-binding winged helix-turn-helix (wHTH) protein/tetratricopeptide (TPR) repeat protein